MILLILIFISGLAIGSFLNVLIDRLPAEESVIKGRSHCDHCKHKLAWYDLIPLLSFILLRRKCRYCQKLISWQYPFIELLTGAFFVLTYFLDSQTSQLPARNAFSIADAGGSVVNCQLMIFTYHLIIISGLIVIFFTDLKYRIIPDKVLAVLIVSSLTVNYLFNDWTFFFTHLLTGIIFFAFFLFLVLVTRGRGMGMGDVKFAFVMGIILGFPKIVVAFYIAFLTGAFISIILILLGKKAMKSTIAFGPFLVAATFIAMFYGDSLWKMLQKMIGI